MAVTMKDLAKYAGVGVATVSSYFNGGRLRPANREKIERAIRELHFEVNEVARGLRVDHTKTVGVIIPELDNQFCAQIITSMEDELRQYGYATIVCDCRTRPEREREAVDFLRRKRVDGLINMPVDGTGGHLKVFTDTERPVVVIDRELPEIECDQILVDNQSAVRKAIGLLLENGHKDIGLLGGPENVATARERLLGYRGALEEAGLPFRPELTEHTDYTISGSREKMEAFCARVPDMTALLALNYETTAGALMYLNEKGIRIPEQLSFIGFDNRDFAQAARPRLTIVEQPTSEIGLQAARRMLARLSRKEEAFRIIKLQARLLMGGSVRALNE